MSYIILFIIGYFSGGILYSSLLPRVFCKIDISKMSEDRNPGTFNAFKYAGMSVGILV